MSSFHEMIQFDMILKVPTVFFKKISIDKDHRGGFSARRGLMKFILAKPVSF